MFDLSICRSLREVKLRNDVLKSVNQVLRIVENLVDERLRIFRGASARHESLVSEADVVFLAISLSCQK